MERNLPFGWCSALFTHPVSRVISSIADTCAEAPVPGLRPQAERRSSLASGSHRLAAGQVWGLAEDWGLHGGHRDHACWGSKSTHSFARRWHPSGPLPFAREIIDSGLGTGLRVNIPVRGGQRQCDGLPARGFHVCLHLHALRCELLRVGDRVFLAPCQPEPGKEPVPPQPRRGRMNGVSAEASGLAVQRPLQPAPWARAAHSLGEMGRIKEPRPGSWFLVPGSWVHSQPALKR